MLQGEGMNKGGEMVDRPFIVPFQLAAPTRQFQN